LFDFTRFIASINFISVLLKSHLHRKPRKLRFDEQLN
jgi:hypothetical protein